MKTVGLSPNHGEPDTVKVVRPVRREGRRNLPLKGGKALLPYSTAPRVVELAYEMEHYATALWVHENGKQYAEGIFRGFEATEGSQAECADKQE